MSDPRQKRGFASVELESRIAETLRQWTDPAAEWAGEVTLVFPGSGGQISVIREERRFACHGEIALAKILVSPWGDLQYGFRKVTYQNGAHHMVIECRTTKIL
jgi:hypothetical protein